MSKTEILDALKRFKTEHAKDYHIQTIGVFGSVARDEANALSDVDVVVETETPNPFNIVHIKEHLENELHQHVDIVRMRERMSDFLKARIEKEAVYV